MRTFILSLALTCISGCATMFNGGTQKVHIVGEPNHAAKVEFISPQNQIASTTLPVIVGVAPSSFLNATVKVDDPCYHSKVIDINREITKSYWANLFNIYGFGIDYLTGAMWNFDDQVRIPLERNEKNAQQCSEIWTQVSDALPYIALDNRKNRYGLGIFGNVQADGRTFKSNSTSFYFEFGRYVDEQTMINLRFQPQSTGSYDYNGPCLHSTTAVSCYSYENNRATHIAVSLRRNIVPKSRLYAGIGISYINYSYFYTEDENYNPTKGDYSSYHYYSETANDSASTFFTEFGWMAPIGRAGLSINAMIDANDIGLRTHRVIDRRLGTMIANKGFSLSGFSIGLSLPL